MFMNPYEIFERDEDDKFGIIVDCKHTETPSVDMELDQKLGHITLESARQAGFKNIILFEDRGDFDIAASELTKLGVWKVIYVFSGTLFGKKSIRSIRRFPHLSAFVKDNFVFRKFFIFETEKYKFFDIRDPFLGNVVDELTHVSMDQLDITYLNPYDDNYEFLEDLSAREIPDIAKLKTTNAVDKKYAEEMVKLATNLFSE